MVYVQDENGKPLMPTRRHGWVRRTLRGGKAEVVRRAPFTIRLRYESPACLTTLVWSRGRVQPVVLGIDPGYGTAGVSATADHAELFSAEAALLPGVSKRLEERGQYRRTRRNRLRHRKPGFRKDTKGEAWPHHCARDIGREQDSGTNPVPFPRSVPARCSGEAWLSPSIRHKLDAHVRIVEIVKTMLPVSRVVIEAAAFDVHKIKNPAVAGVGYQRGEQYGFDNVREYVLHRDKHRCGNPRCPDKKAKAPILQVHHIGYWKGDRSDRPANLIALCVRCHTPSNHQPGGFLHGWTPKLPTLRAATFMATMRRALTAKTGAETTYGYITKGRRRELGLDKTHANDAFVVAGGTNQPRAETLAGVQRRRNNRALEKFRDAAYIDLRDGKTRSGKDLSSQRRRRSRENLPESLRRYRARKVRKGGRSIRTVRHPYQPGDIVRVGVGNAPTAVKGTHCKGARAVLSDGRSVAVSKLALVAYGKGIVFSNIGGGASSPASMPGSPRRKNG